MPYKEFEKIYPATNSDIDPITLFKTAVPNDICVLLICKNEGLDDC